MDQSVQVVGLAKIDLILVKTMIKKTQLVVGLRAECNVIDEDA